MSHFLSSEYPQSPPAEARFHILSAPLEQTVSYGSGTANGPAAIIEASYQLEAFDGSSYPGEQGIHTHPPTDCSTGDITTILERIQDTCTPIYQAGKIPVTLGGEHTLSIAPITALHNILKDFGVIQIDAHADLRHTYEDSPHSHACVMRRVHDLGIPIFQIGIRNLCKEEIDLRAANPDTIHHLDAREIYKHGIPKNILPKNFPKNIYLTFDVDGLDASLMPATGTPEPGGLTWFQALEACENATKGRTILGIDIVELAPIENDHASPYTTAKLTYALMGMVK